MAIEFTIRQQLGAGPTGGLTNFVHTLNLQPFQDAFSCDGTYTLEQTRNGVTTVRTGPYSVATTAAIPFTKTPPDVVNLRIDFDVPAAGCPFDLGIGDVLGQYHGEWLFFDPWIQPWDTGEKIQLLRPPESEYRILAVPVDWQWPVPDGKHIWDYYPKVNAPDPSKPQEGPIFVPQWWVDSFPLLAQGRDVQFGGRSIGSTVERPLSLHCSPSPVHAGASVRCSASPAVVAKSW